MLRSDSTFNDLQPWQTTDPQNRPINFLHGHLAVIANMTTNKP